MITRKKKKKQLHGVVIACSDALHAGRCPGALLILHPISHCSGYVFVPDNSETVIDPRIPPLYNITTAQTCPPTDENPLIGYYMSSFLTTTTGNQYYVLTGIFRTAEMTSYGFNILDLRTLKRVAYGKTTAYSTTDTTSSHFTRDAFALFRTNPTNLAIAVRANATASREDGSQCTNLFPAAITSGWLRIPSSISSLAEWSDAYTDTALQTIDTSASFSWYDCIWGRLGPPDGHYTWFNLYLDDSELILVAYLIDESSTIHIRPRRNSSALLLEPVDHWELGIGGRGLLSIRSVLAGQRAFEPGRAGKITLSL
ncbi:hypothetical protein BDW71DRAFT_195363 [Aspergillus fruticulosus]